MRIHFLFGQEEWTRRMHRVPVKGEKVTFGTVEGEPKAEYTVSIVHWMDLTPTEMIPFVSLYLER